jgi:hypothetical protein
MKALSIVVSFMGLAAVAHMSCAQSAGKNAPINPALRELGVVMKPMTEGISADCRKDNDECVVRVKVYAPGKAPIKPPNPICAAVVIGTEVIVAKGVAHTGRNKHLLTWRLEKAAGADPVSYEFDRQLGVNMAIAAESKYHGNNRDFKNGKLNANKTEYSFEIVNSRVRHKDCAVDGLCEITYVVNVQSPDGLCQAYDPKILNDGP